MYSQQKIKRRDDVIDEHFLKAKKILNEYSLCDFCLGRLFAKQKGVKSIENLGNKIKKYLGYKSTKKCIICKEILSNSDLILNRIVEKSIEYDFSTFVIGTILRPSITDRDDALRSRFQLRGVDSVKTSITQLLSKKFAKITKTKVNYLHPDLTITFNFKTDSVELKSRHIFFQGRYLKKSRGLPQKQSSCENCNGKGCNQCSFHGIAKFNSVEGLISKFLFKKFQGTLSKITWIGGEDKNSLVLGNGRPFFIKLMNPKKRKIRIPKKIMLDGIEVKNLKKIEKIPKKAILFKSKIELSVETEKILESGSYALLKTHTQNPISIYEKPNKRIEKKIFSLKFKKTSPKTFNLKFIADGGFPIKRFVEGNNIYPNLSEILENKCKCRNFDFHEISLK